MIVVDTTIIIDHLRDVPHARQAITEAVGGGHVANRYRHPPSGIDTVDFVVAATAVGLGADVWTRNVRHFPMFAGLQPPY